MNDENGRLEIQCSLFKGSFESRTFSYPTLKISSKTWKFMGYKSTFLMQIIINTLHVVVRRRSFFSNFMNCIHFCLTGRFYLSILLNDALWNHHRTYWFDNLKFHRGEYSQFIPKFHNIAVYFLLLPISFTFYSNLLALNQVFQIHKLDCYMEYALNILCIQFHGLN